MNNFRSTMGAHTASSNAGRKLIVNYLHQTYTDRCLYSTFVTAGQIECCNIMRDSKNGYSFGFGFVTYVKPEDAEKAIELFNGLEIMGKRIKVSYARPSGDSIKGTNLYITKLPRHYLKADIESLFGQYGTIIQCNPLNDRLTKNFKGVAFVRFDLRTEADAAIAALNNQIPPGCSEAIEVRVAEDHGRNKAAYFSGLMAGREYRNVLKRGKPYSRPPQHIPANAVPQPHPSHAATRFQSHPWRAALKRLPRPRCITMMSQSRPSQADTMSMPFYALPRPNQQPPHHHQEDTPRLDGCISYPTKISKVHKFCKFHYHRPQ